MVYYPRLTKPRLGLNSDRCSAAWRMFTSRGVAARLLIPRRFRPQALDLRATRLLFQRAILRAPRLARRYSLRRTVVQTLDLLAQLPETDCLISMLASLLLRSNHHA